MKKTITIFKTDGLSTNAANLYKFIATLCHCKSESGIKFEGRDSDLFCRLYDCTGEEYLKAIRELVIEGIVGGSEPNIILHPSLYIFDEDLDYEPPSSFVSKMGQLLNITTTKKIEQYIKKK